MKLRIFRKVSKFPNGKEYLLDNETGEPAEFDSKKDILNLFKSESEVGIDSEEALIKWGINIEEAQ